MKKIIYLSAFFAVAAFISCTKENNSSSSSGGSGPVTGNANYVSGDIYTIAGNGTHGYSGDGGVATAAEISSPYAVVVDRAGNFYIADYGNYRIRKVNTSGTISTIAGNGTQGHSGDGGPATSAEIGSSYGIAIDGTGNIYFSDGESYIRKINTSGIISTFAGSGSISSSGDGGPATAAGMWPFSVAVDVTGNIYITDFSNNSVRKVNTGGIISTIAGNGTAGFSGDGGPAISAELNVPRGLFVDNAGNVYVADENNSRIRKINTIGIISTIAGNGTTGFSGDGGPATSAGIVPFSVALDGGGNVYIADLQNNRIRMVNTAGIISTIAGNGTIIYSGDNGPAIQAGLLGDAGLTIDSYGSIYLAGLDNRIREVYK